MYPAAHRAEPVEANVAPVATEHHLPDLPVLVKRLSCSHSEAEEHERNNPARACACRKFEVICRSGQVLRAGLSLNALHDLIEDGERGDALNASTV